MASVSKQFTATAILLLAEDGLIDLDEDIRTYLPELPDYGAKVTIQSMLGHVSGMGDYDLIASGYEGEKIENGIDLKSVAGGPFRLGNEDYLTIEEFYNIVKRVKLKNRPMEKADYSNLAYFLFSMLIEEKSGLTLREFAEKNIFKPLGMSQTIYSDDVNEIIKNRASGYKKKETGDYKISMTNLAMVGDGGLHTSINDFIKWDNNFYSPVLGKQPSDFIKKLNTPNSNLTIGDALYANGQFVTQQLDRKVYSHSGGWLGFSTFYLRFPEHYFSIITLCNDEGSNPEKYSIEIAKLYFNLIGSR
jgi:CubicO group peptidase (beta-lactamase class C family)